MRTISCLVLGLLLASLAFNAFARRWDPNYPPKTDDTPPTGADNTTDGDDDEKCKLPPDTMSFTHANWQVIYDAWLACLAGQIEGSESGGNPSSEQQDCNSCEGTANTGSTETDNDCVLFTVPFGHFPQNTNFPSGKLRIESRKMNPILYTPAIVRYDHPMTRHISKQEIVGGKRKVTIRYKGIYSAVYQIESDGYGRSTGISTRKPNYMRTLDSNKNLTMGNDIAFYDEITPARDIIRYSASTGAVVEMKMSNGPWVDVANLDIDFVYNESDSSLAQIYNSVDGLMNIALLHDSSFRIEWYKLADVGEFSPTTNRYALSGTPVKTWTISNPSEKSNSIKKFHILEERGEFKFEYLWTYYDQLNDWILRKGIGDNATENSKQITKNGDIREVVVTQRSVNGKVLSKSKIIYKRFAFGERPVTYIGDYGGLNYTTNYEYDNAGNSIKSDDSRGLSVTREYDAFRRLTKETHLVAHGTQTIVYSYQGEKELRPSTSIVSVNGREIRRNIFTYNENFADNPYGDGTHNGKVNFVTTATMVNGVTHTSVTETYSSTAPAHLAGRAKRVLQNEGTEYIYEYAALANGGHRQIMTTQVNGSVVAGQSTRSVADFDAADHMIRSESYVHTGDGFELTSWENYTYNPAGKVIRIDYSDGTFSTADYICKGPIWEIDREGIRTDYYYDTAKRRYKTVRHSPHGGETTELTYDAADRVIATTRTVGSISETTRTEYDRAGRVVKTIDTTGLATTHAYSADMTVETVTDPAGATQISTYVVGKGLVSVTGTGVVPQYYGFSLVDGLEKNTVHVGSPNSPRWTASYRNGFGQTVKSESPGFGGSVITSTNTYNAKGQVVQTQTAGRPTETYEYNSFGERVKSTVSADGVSRISENGSRYVSTNGVIWQESMSKVYCSDASIAPIITSSRSQLSGLSNALRSKSQSTDARGNVSESWSTYDPATRKAVSYSKVPGITTVSTSTSIDRRTVSSTDFAGITTTYGYDDFGRQISTTDGRGNTARSVYDDKGRLTQSIDAIGATTEYVYDNVGRLTAIKDPMGKYTRYGYDVKGQRTVVYGDNTYPLVFEYNDFGEKSAHYTFRLADNLTSQPAATQGDRTSYTFDPATGLLLAKTYADGSATRYNYTTLGQLSRRTWARGVTTDYTYDAFSQLLTTTYSDSAHPISNTYDASGQLLTVTDAKGITTFRYNQYGQQILEDVVGIYTKSLAVHYDSLGKNKGYSLGNERITYSYDADNGRMVGMDIGGNRNFTFGYLPNTHLQNTITYPNDMVKTVSFEQQRNLVTSMEHTNGASQISKYAYVNDEFGRRISKTQTYNNASKVFDYGYNDRSEVTSAKQQNNVAYNYLYDFDNIGNRKSATEGSTAKTYAANPLNQYTSADGFTPTFDADGNQTTIKTSTGIWNVAYNGENRPIRFTQGDTTITMSYDYMGRRFLKTYNNIIQKFVYRGYTQIEELDEVNTTVKSYVWGPSVSVPVAFTYNGSTCYYLHDINKNVAELVANDGTIAAHYEYSPFGQVTDSAGPIVEANIFRFSSEYFDFDLGLSYYNYRHYNALDGCWLSRDPVSEKGGYNLYAFVGNNPLNAIDALGLWWSGKAGRLGRWINAPTHEWITVNAMREVTKTLEPSLFTNQIPAGCYNERRFQKARDRMMTKGTKAIIDANDATDASPFDNDLKYHYNRQAKTRKGDAETPKDIAIGNYKSELGKVRGKHNDAFQGLGKGKRPSEGDCETALENLGRLTHMWQDYYAHGVAEDVENNYNYTTTVGPVVGSPDNPSMTPVSWDNLWNPAGHGFVEPPMGNSSLPQRVNASVEFTFTKLKPEMRLWISRCFCTYYINTQ